MWSAGGVTGTAGGTTGVGRAARYSFWETTLAPSQTADLRRSSPSMTDVPAGMPMPARVNTAGSIGRLSSITSTVTVSSIRGWSSAHSWNRYRSKYH